MRKRLTRTRNRVGSAGADCDSQPGWSRPVQGVQGVQELVEGRIQELDQGQIEGSEQG